MTDAHWWPMRFEVSGRRRNRSESAPPPTPPAPRGLGEVSDAELARRLGDADGAALSELYQRFGRLCYSLARRVCADDRLAEDVVHGVFQVLWRDPRCFDPARGNFATSLLMMIHHKAVDAARRQGSARPDPVAAEAAEEISPPLAATARAEAARVTACQVRAALDQLPGEQREVLTGAYFGGRTLREIAASTGVPLGTVKHRMLAGVQRLRSLLTEQLGPDALVAEARAVWRVIR